MTEKNPYLDGDTCITGRVCDDGSFVVDIDDVASLIQKYGRVWLDKSEYTEAERESIFEELDHVIHECVKSVKHQIREGSK